MGLPLQAAPVSRRDGRCRCFADGDAEHYQVRSTFRRRRGGPMAFAVARSWREAVVDLLARDRLAQPDELPLAVNAAAAPLGIDITMYAVDQEQRVLRPVPHPGRALPPPLPVRSTIAGRVFMSSQPLSTASGP